MKKLNSKKSGFTLIELIVVIAIIGILVAITVPRLSTYIKTAQVTAEYAAAKSIYTATIAYNTEIGDGHGGVKYGRFTQKDLEPYIDGNATIVNRDPKKRGEYSVVVDRYGNYSVGFWDVSAKGGKGAVTTMMNGIVFIYA